MNPKDLRYSKDHEWVSLDASGIATIGISEYAQKELGDVVFVDFPQVGNSFKQSEKFGEVESVKSVSELIMPIGGEVVETNKSLVGEPELVNSSPYDEGWMLKVKPSNPDDINNLMTYEQYESYTATLK